MDDGGEDRSLDARLYDAIHRGNAGDVRFYRDVCAGADRVLELGCGTGRILRALAAAGHDVTGLDRDQGRLELCRERAGADGAVVRLVLGDIAGFDLPGPPFDRIVAPYHVLTCLLDDGAVAGCFAAVRNHLAPRGRFVFDGYVLDPADLASSGLPAGPPATLVTFVEGETTVRVFERDVVRPDPGCIDVEYTFHLHRPGRGVRVRTQIVRHRVRTPEAWVEALEAGGFEVVEGPTVRRPPGATPWFTVVAAPAAAGSAG